jgi:hypothetical protein
LTALFHLGGLAALRGLDWHSTDSSVVTAAGRRLLLQLGLWLVAGLFWLGLLGWLYRQQSRQGQPLGGTAGLIGVALLGLLMRLPALALPQPVHSGDIYRYLWDGAVQQAGDNPYLGPPGAPVYAAVAQTRPTLYARINHRHLPTIYPPTAQLIFAAAAQLRGQPAAGASDGQWLTTAQQQWRWLAAASEVLLWLVLWRLLRPRSGPPGSPPTDEPAEGQQHWLALWLLCPLPAIEIWLNGHLDCFALLLLGLTLLAQRWRRQGSGALIAGGLLGLALLVKPLAAALLPGQLAQRRPLLLRLGGGLVVALLLVFTPCFSAAAKRWWPSPTARPTTCRGSRRGWPGWSAVATGPPSGRTSWPTLSPAVPSLG